MPYFQPVVFQGTTFHCQHLNPFQFGFASGLAKKALTVWVIFSNHCFTKGFVDGLAQAGDSVLVDGGGRDRSFCPDRHQASFGLPALIQGLNHPQAKVFQTAERRNWVHSVLIPTPAGPYHVFFTVHRAVKGSGHDLKLSVESAYPEDPSELPPATLGRISFQLLCSKVYLGQPVSTKR